MNRTVTGLRKSIKKNPSNAGLKVYITRAIPEFEKAWSVTTDRVMLNLGEGRYATVSKHTYHQIEKYLLVQ